MFQLFKYLEIPAHLHPKTSNKSENGTKIHAHQVFSDCPFYPLDIRHESHASPTKNKVACFC